jgi:hypothetical protein
MFVLIGWWVPTWFDYKRALRHIAEYYELTDSLKYEESKLPLYRNLKLEGEMIIGLTLIGDSTFFDMATTGWIEGDQWQPQNETTIVDCARDFKHSSTARAYQKGGNYNALTWA